MLGSKFVVGKRNCIVLSVMIQTILLEKKNMMFE
jgi:hypothetical protein